MTDIRVSTDATGPQAALTAASEANGWRGRRRYTWVRPTHPVAVRVDEPAGRVAVGAVVFAPSFGREATVSARTLRAAAVHAARAGFRTSTFSFSGDGDSAALTPDADPAHEWERDLAEVVAEARRAVGPAAPVHVVGLRLGAAVVDRLPQQGPGVRILWEPVSGRRFLTQHRMIRRQSIAVPPVGEGVELDGAWLTDTQAAGIAALVAPRSGTDGPERRVRFEEDRRTARHIALGAPYYADVPMAAIDEILTDLPAGAPRPLPAWDGAPHAVFDTPSGPVVETFCEIGRDGLPGVLTRPATGDVRAGMLFTAMGAEVRWGPGQVWSVAARSLAADGVVSLRADRGGIGDDADPDRVPEPRPYTLAAGRDVSAAARHLRVAVDGAPVVGVGVCAGAWALLTAADDARFDHVVAINPVHYNPDERVYTEAFYAHYHDGGQDYGLEAPPEAPTRAAAWWARRRRELALRHPRLRSLIRPDVPVDSVDSLLRGVPSHTAVHLVLDHEAHEIFDSKGGRRALRRATRRGGPAIRVTVDEGIDHSLFAACARDRVLDLLRSAATPSTAGAAPARFGRPDGTIAPQNRC